MLLLRYSVILFKCVRFPSTQIVVEEFLEDINNILNSGEVLFTFVIL